MVEKVYVTYSMSFAGQATCQNIRLTDVNLQIR